MGPEVYVGQTLYARNGDKVVVAEVSADTITVTYRQKRYVRSVDAVGKTLFTSNPLEEAAAEEYEGDAAFGQETRHLSETQKALESFDGFLLEIRIGDNGFVVGTETGFEEVTKDELLANPYFARMDLDIADTSSRETEQAYVGKKGVYHGDRLLVSDWRSEIGQRYYMKSITRFRHNGMDYELLLRRALRIHNGVLTGYENEYAKAAYLKALIGSGPAEAALPAADGAAEPPVRSELVTDPFLQEIIRQKHYQSKLTDIIESIQANQNAIITYDENANVVVQGCAGSGKTMILLHRLSFIKYRNRSLDLSGIKILTPNNLFRMYINDLSRSLELSKIERLTVDEYYATLLEKYYRLELTQLGKKFTTGDLKVYRETLLDPKKSAAGSWPAVYSNALRERMKESAVAQLRYLRDFKIRCGEAAAVLKNRLNTVLDDNVYDIRNIAALRGALLNVSETFKPYYDQLSACRRSEAAWLAAEKDFLSAKTGVQDADRLLDGVTQEILGKTPHLRDKYEQRKRELLHERFLRASPELDRRLRECELCLQAVVSERAKHVYEIDKKSLREEKDRIPFSEEEMALIGGALAQTDAFSIGAIENDVVKVLEREYAVVLGFRDRMYTKLLVYYVVLGALSGGDRLLCVDEGHDLYAGEYRLFYLVAGGNLRFNIYGDINQIIRQGEGIGDWDNLYSIFDFTLFTLNENYRNSSEIIEYSNETLGFSTTNLGVGGGIVRTLDFGSFIAHVNDNILGTRKIAILAERKTPALIKKLRAAIDEPLSLDEIGPGSISLLTPPEAKGLEFDTCYVLTNGMNRNELYLSYTRALNELYVVPSRK